MKYCMHATHNPLWLRFELEMAPRPRYTISLNLRSQDQNVLEALTRIAQKQGCTLTTLCRDVLADFVKQSGAEVSSNQKLDGFLASSNSLENMYRVLTPAELKTWTNNDLLYYARLIRSRKYEIESALRARGFWFKW
jgi:hypothetical protein